MKGGGNPTLERLSRVEHRRDGLEKKKAHASNGSTYFPPHRRRRQIHANRGVAEPSSPKRLAASESAEARVTKKAIEKLTKVLWIARLEKNQ